MDLEICGFELCDIGIKIGFQSANENEESGDFKFVF